MSKQIVHKVTERSEASEAGIALQLSQNREIVLSVEADCLERMRKSARVCIEQPQGSTFSIICDEGPYLHGDDSAPPPLAYFSVGIAFCTLTQMSRYAEMTKLNIKHVSLKQKIRFFMKGSALKGTLAGGGLGLQTDITVESDEPADKIREMVRIGEQSCFALQSLVQPVPVETTATLNGERLELAAKD